MMKSPILKTAPDAKIPRIEEKSLKTKSKNDRFKLKKTRFAEMLRNEMRINFSIEKGRIQYPFEEILGKFIKKIQMRQFPKDE